jgi:hypothetical protein
MERSFDPVIAKNAVEVIEQNKGLDWQLWLDDHRNVMLVDGGDVGMATFEYPGFYNLHWFFESRGRAAIKQAHAMMDKFFKDFDVSVVRGLTPIDIKPARWLARQIGFKSYGTVEYPDGPYELFIMTKQEFKEILNGRR